MSKAREKIIEAREIHLFDALDPEDGQRQFAVRFPTNPKFDSSVENSADLIFVVSGVTNSNLRALTNKRIFQGLTGKDEEGHFCLVRQICENDWRFDGGAFAEPIRE